MAEKLEDLNLPNASVLKIIKEALPDSVNVGKDARSALSRAASVFVLYVTSQASKESQKCKRKTLTAQDVLTALEELEFEEFLEPLQQCHEEFIKLKKEKSAKKKRHATADAEENEDSPDEIVGDEATE